MERSGRTDDSLGRTDSILSNQSQASFGSGVGSSASSYEELQQQPLKALSSMFYETVRAITKLDETEALQTPSSSTSSWGTLRAPEHVPEDTSDTGSDVSAKLSGQARPLISPPRSGLQYPGTSFEASRPVVHLLGQIESLSGGVHEAKALSELSQLRNDPTNAQLRSAVMNCLDRLRIAYEVDVRIGHEVDSSRRASGDATESVYTIDAALSGSFEGLAIVVDGPLHLPFLRRVRDRFLRARHWSLVVVPHFEWERLQEPQEQETYISQRLSSLFAEATETKPSINSDSGLSERLSEQLPHSATPQIRDSLAESNRNASKRRWDCTQAIPGSSEGRIADLYADAEQEQPEKKAACHPIVDVPSKHHARGST